MTGEELVGKVLQIRPEMLVILCSGRDGEGKAGKAGIRKTLRKPFRLRELTKTVRRVLDDA